MRNYIIAFIAVFALSACSSTQLLETAQTILGGESSNPVTQQEAGKGIKEALVKGVSTGVSNVSQVDGFFKNAAIKVLIPEEAKKVENTIRDLGLDPLADRAIESMNRAAEEASKEAKAIFVTAIKSLTFQDALAIVRGDEAAATNFLRRTTTSQLQAKFKPVVQRNLDKVGATKHYKTMMDKYNQIPLVKPINSDLAAHVTDRAIFGLFMMIEKEEKNIRENPIARTTEILKRVFGLNDK